MNKFFWTMSACQKAVDIPNNTINLFCGHNENGMYIGERKMFSGSITRPLYRSVAITTILASFLVAIPVFLTMLPFALALDACIGFLKLCTDRNEESYPLKNSNI